MTVTNFDVKNDSAQATCDFSLVRAVDLLSQINEIQSFLTSSVICDLSDDIPLTLNEKQSELLGEISTGMLLLMRN